MSDDPFERAARREAALLSMPNRASLRPLLGLQLAWALLLGLHWWVADGDGRALAVHTTAFVIGVSFLLFATVANLGPRWGVFAVVAGWAPLLAMHWVRTGERRPATTIHTIVFTFALAAAVIAAFATPSRSDG
jgi:hypothetical protein